MSPERKAARAHVHRAQSSQVESSGMVHEMDMLDIVSVVGIAVLVVVVVGMGRMGWRIWHGNEEMEAGGSMSRQMFGTNHKRAFSKWKRRAEK